MRHPFQTARRDGSNRGAGVSRCMYMYKASLVSVGLLDNVRLRLVKINRTIDYIIDYARCIISQRLYVCYAYVGI